MKKGEKEMKKLLECVGFGKVGGDCTGPVYYEVIGEPTVKELAEYIVSNKGEWGYVGIKNKYGWNIFGNPTIEYFHGIFCDENRKEISFNFPDIIANAKVRQVKASGGWSRMDYFLIIDDEIIRKYNKDIQDKKR